MGDAEAEDRMTPQTFEVAWLRHHNRGRSSDAMVDYVLGRTSEPDVDKFPLDWGDFARCLDAYFMAPLPLKYKMESILDRYARFVIERIAKRTV